MMSARYLDGDITPPLVSPWCCRYPALSPSGLLAKKLSLGVTVVCVACVRAEMQAMRRCDVASAAVIMVLANKFTSDYHQEDARNVVRAMAIQR